MELPNDINMLLSIINMKLRDGYDSLDKLCDDMQIDKNSLLEKMKTAGYEYSKKNKKFW